MKILIMADMEGVSGIVTWSQVMGGAPMYEEGRKLYTEEINAAVRGAKRAGADEIVVVDCHGAGGDWTFNSFVPEMIDVRLYLGGASSLGTLHGIVRAGRRCLLAGGHARAQQHRRRRTLPHDLHSEMAQSLVQR